MMHVIAAVHTAGDREIAITWREGDISRIDIAPMIAEGGVFTALKDPAIFAAVRVGYRGRSVLWLDRDGDEIDLCADALWLETHKSQDHAA